jgi:hypothetical protein
MQDEADAQLKWIRENMTEAPAAWRQVWITGYASDPTSCWWSEKPISRGIEYVSADAMKAQIDAAVKAERAAASEYCWQRYQNREPMNLTSPAVFTSHSHQDIVEHMQRAAAIRKGEQP